MIRRYVKVMLGLIMIVTGIALGLYVTIWVCFIGGIIQIVDAVRAPVLSSQGLAFGIARVVFAGFAGWLTGILLVAPGISLLED